MVPLPSLIACIVDIVTNLVTQNADQNTWIESIERHLTITPKHNRWPPMIPEYSPLTCVNLNWRQLFTHNTFVVFNYLIHEKRTLIDQINSFLPQLHISKQFFTTSYLHYPPHFLSRFIEI